MPIQVGVTFYQDVTTTKPFATGVEEWDTVVIRLLEQWRGKTFDKVTTRDGQQVAGAPLWSPVQLSIPKRANKNVESVWAIGLDFDDKSGVPPTLDTLEETFGDWTGFAYTTKSHTKEKPRARVALVFNRPITPGEYKKVWKWAERRCTAVGLVLDSQCKDQSRGFFVPHEDFLWRKWEGTGPLRVAEIITGSMVEDGRPDGELWEVPGDTEIWANNGGEDFSTTVSTWAAGSAVGDKLKCYCPIMGGPGDSSLGAAFLRRRRGGVLFVCTSANHGHETTPYRGWWDDGTRGTGRPPISRGILQKLEWNTDAQGNRKALKSSLYNLEVILENDATFKERLWYNLFSSKYMYDERPVEDDDLFEIRRWVEWVYRVHYGKNDVFDGVRHVCRKTEVNPLLDELNSYIWDGVERCEEYLLRGMGADDCPLNRDMSKKWLIQAVARAYSPGCKVDTVLIFQGEQGDLKSTAHRIMTGEKWFSDSPIPIGHEFRAFMQLGAAWIHEMAELSVFKSRETEKVKSFVTSSTDTFVPSYGKFVVTVPRQCIFVGSTNEEEFLVDQTGNRRYWVVRVGNVDIEWITANREQLWAEAIVRYKRGEQWHFTDEMAEVHKEAVAEFEQTDSWEILVIDWLNQFKPAVVSVGQVLADALELGAVQHTRANQTRVGVILQKSGYRKRRISRGNARPWVYVRKTATEREIIQWQGAVDE